MRVELRFTAGSRAGQNVALDDNQTLVLGRGTDTNCRIQDPSISRRHCTVTNSPQGLVIADLGSSNGTFVNGQKVTHWRALRPGDEIHLGQNAIQVHPYPSQPMAPRPPQASNPFLANASQNFNMGQQMQRAPQYGQPNPMYNAMQQSFANQQFANQSHLGQMQSYVGSQVGQIGMAQANRPPMPGNQMGMPQGMPGMHGGQAQPDFDPYMIEGYVVERKLGQGAFGAVFKGIQQSSGLAVALKTIRPNHVQNKKDVARFFREARSGAALVHPNIIRIYDAGESRGNYYIAMEFVDGREVAQLIEQYGRLDVGYSLRIAIQIANALAHAFEKSIVHRDIKPENILVNQQAQAKLVDFGLAKNFQQSGVSGLTAPGEGMGTLAYMPPEQLDNALMADQRSDIYSLGATLYHMLTGQRPFNEKTTRKFIMKILNKMPDPIRTMNPQVPQALEEILEKAMAKEPEDRYQQPAEFESELKRIFDEMARQYNQR